MRDYMDEYNIGLPSLCDYDPGRAAKVSSPPMPGVFEPRSKLAMRASTEGLSRLLIKGLLLYTRTCLWVISDPNYMAARLDMRRRSSLTDQKDCN